MEPVKTGAKNIPSQYARTNIRKESFAIRVVATWKRLPVSNLMVRVNNTSLPVVIDTIHQESQVKLFIVILRHG
jgi:hypothetical protein